MGENLESGAFCQWKNRKRKQKKILGDFFIFPAVSWVSLRSPFRIFSLWFVSDGSGCDSNYFRKYLLQFEFCCCFDKIAKIGFLYCTKIKIKKTIFRTVYDFIQAGIFGFWTYLKKRIFEQILEDFVLKLDNFCLSNSNSFKVKVTGNLIL